MAERIISPGVFTKEVDQSFLAGGIAQIGAAVIGPTVKGPALLNAFTRSAALTAVTNVVWSLLPTAT